MNKYLVVLLGSASLLAGNANAASFGVYGNSTTAAAAAAVAGGNTATVLSNLSAASLTGLNVLWVLNSDNGNQPAALDGSADVAAFVNAGGVLVYHDRNVTSAASALDMVGAAGITFVRNPNSSIDVENAVNPLITGPGGTITNATLDGGNSSSHGYAVLGTLPAGAVSILNNGTAGNIVDFYYSYGNGKVYYSSIPLDFYLGGSGNNGDSFRNIYTPNLVAQAGALAGAVNPAVPEPATWGMMIAGFAVVGSAMRRRATKVSFA